jgi:hypothetical protein
MSGLLSDVLPFLYSQGDRAKRYMNGLLADPVGTMQQTAGGIVDAGNAQQGLLGQAFGNPQRPFLPTDRAALAQASDNALIGLLGLASAGMAKAPLQGEKLGLDYQINHKPMAADGGAAPLHDLTQSFPADIYGPASKALQYYGSGLPEEAQVLKQIQALKGKPDATVTIYRGVPDGVNKINPGDWVTLHPDVAKEYGNVLSMQVPASHVTAWPDSLLEFGYHPPSK